MDIATYFDPYKIEHLKAYRYLQRHGTWPLGFIPDNMEFPNGWHFLIMNKFVNAWLDYRLPK